MRVAVRARQQPDEREPGRHRREQRPGGAGEQQHEGNEGSGGHRARVEAARDRARRRRLRGCGLSVCLRLGPSPQPAPVDQHLDGARERRPDQQAGERQRQRVRTADLDPDPAADRVIGAGVRVEPAGDHPDEERRRGRVVEEAHRGAGEELWPEAHAAGVEPPEDRRAHRLGQRNAEAGRPDDRHGLEHRRGACTEAEPGTTTLSHARERNTTRQGDPEPARRRGPRGEERDHGHVGRSGRGARSHGGRP